MRPKRSRRASLAVIAMSSSAALVAFPEYATYEKKKVDATFPEVAEPLDGPVCRELASSPSSNERIHPRVVLVFVSGDSHNKTCSCNLDQRWGLTMEWTEKHEACLKQLTMLVGRGSSVQDAKNTLTVLGLDSLLLDEVESRYRDILEAVIGKNDDDVLEPSTREPWYFGPQNDDQFWPELREQLRQQPKWKDAVPSLDATSTAVVARLGNPASPQFATRGLVLGYVQSGKTANFTATIAKAADAGYRLFIVLSGVHNSLRRQTQLRLEQQIVDLNPTNWVGLTTEDADFGNPVMALPLVAGSELKLLAVVKKNVSRLTNLVNWLETAQKHGALNKCPILIIDDEADQASVNTANTTKPGSELDTSAIHAKLKELLNFPKVSYLGYTATPFANVLANPKDPDGIYPRDFIYPLPKPKDYFGAEELFGTPVPEDEESPESNGHDMIRFVPEGEASAYVVTARKSPQARVSPALADAIRWFIMATAARRVRANEDDHSSMLVHTTMRVQPQLDFVPTIKKYVRSLTAEWSSGAVDSWRAQWEFETLAEPAERHELRPISFEELASAVGDVLSRVQVLADNSFSDDRLIYTDQPATVIAVGGNTLSRGLTLEGLISSFFLRGSTMYDSALQMGRWFGYRTGYADLPRVWTTASLAKDFRFLSEIESSIREDIARYAVDGLTPSELAVRLLLHPKMQITSKLKMQYAVPVSASFSAARPQTIMFEHRNKVVVGRNWEAATKLISGNSGKISRGADNPGPLLMSGVSHEDVLQFLDKYSFHASSEMGGSLLADYIRRQVAFGKLASWNVAVISRDSPHPDYDDVNLGLNRPFHAIGRSRVVVGDPQDWDKSAYLKAITSASDFTADFDRHPTSIPAVIKARNESDTPLLLIYPIAPNSKPSAPQQGAGKKGEQRVALDAVGPLIGLAMSLPTAAPGSEPKDMMHVDLGKLDSSKIPFSSDDDTYVDTEKTLNQVSLGG